MTVARAVAVALALTVIIILAGCSGSDDDSLFLNVSERASWSALNRLAFAAFGGDGQLYVYRCNTDGGGKYILTRSDDDPDTSLDEGGWTPCFSPSGTQVAFIGQRGGGSASIMLLDTDQGDRVAVQNVTSGAAVGTDAQPSWRPDGQKIIFATTKVSGGGTGGFDIATVNPDGTGLEYIVATNEREQWPVYSPDSSKIAFQRGPAAGPVDIIIHDLGTQTETNLTTALRTGPADATRFEAPCWGSVGGTEYIYFHSNRDTFFDIYRIKPDGSGLERITSTNSNGFPVLNPAGTRLLFTRDRELWTSDPGPGAPNATRVVRRY